LTQYGRQGTCSLEKNDECGQDAGLFPRFRDELRWRRQLSQKTLKAVQRHVGVAGTLERGKKVRKKLAEGIGTESGLDQVEVLCRLDRIGNARSGKNRVIQRYFIVIAHVLYYTDKQLDTQAKDV